MTRHNADPITAVSVVDNTKQVWYVAVVVIAGGITARAVLLVALQKKVPTNAESSTYSGYERIRISSKKR